MNKTSDLARLSRPQAYGEYVTRHLLVLIEMIDRGDGPPNNATLSAALKEIIRNAVAEIEAGNVH